MGIFHLEEPPEAWQREERPGQETDTWAHGRGCSLGTRLHPRLTARTVLQGERTLWPLGPHHLDGPKVRTSGQAHKQLQALMHPLSKASQSKLLPPPVWMPPSPAFPACPGASLQYTKQFSRMKNCPNPIASNSPPGRTGPSQLPTAL